MRLDLEGDGPAAADVDDAGVLTHADEEVLPHGVGRARAELLGKVLLGGLVGAVLGPHDGVHGQLGVGGSASEDVADALVFVLFEAEFLPGHVLAGGRGGVLDGVGQLAGVFGGHSCFHSKDHGRGRGTLTGEGAARRRQPTRDARTERKMPRPSVPRGDWLHRVRGRAGRASLGRVLGVGHEADDVARGVGDASDVIGTAVGVDVDVAEHDAAFALKPFKLGGRRLEVAFTVLHGDHDFLAGAKGVGPGGVGVSIRSFCSRQMNFWWSLRIRAPGSRWASVRIWKPLQMPSTGHAFVGGVDYFLHYRGEAGDGAAA